MEIVILLVPLALILSGAGLAAFIWAFRKGQFEDLDSPATKILFEDKSK